MGKTKKYKEHLLKSLENPKEAAAYLDACLEDADLHVFLLALKDVAEARGGVGQLSKNLRLTDRASIDHFQKREILKWLMSAQF